jgi:hypothetical protein
MNYRAKLYAKLRNVETENDFVELVYLLVEGLRKEPDDWGANQNLELYLDGVASYILNTRSKRRGEERPDELSWRQVATMLCAAADYD